MNITRHNYEEYFILYMDNELGNDERRMVETFVQNNPDLKDELDLLGQFKMTPDTTITYQGKECLLKSTDNSSINSSDYEEWLMLYIDNEATNEQRKDIESFIAANPAIKKELELLQRTKLHPEQIIFTAKESLYRKEEKLRSLPVRWWRAAAAILILVLGFTAAILFYNKPTGNKDEIATIPGKEKTTPIDNTPALKQEIANIDNIKLRVNNPAVTEFDKNNLPNKKLETNKIAVKEKKEKLKFNTPFNSPLMKKEEQVIVENNKLSNDLPKPINNANLKNNADKNAIADTDIPNINTNQSNPVTDVAVTKITTPPSDIINASYPVDNADFDQSGGKKNKLRGLFRKVTRTFEKRTNIDPTDDDNRLLIGGLAIRMK